MLDGADLPSLDVTSENLADAVERAAAGRNRTALQRATGLSARTLRDILDPTSPRRFGHATINKLDAPLDWPAGTAWRIYRQPREPSTDDRTTRLIAAQMEQIAERVALLEGQPTWAGEVLDAFRPLRPADRALLLSLARRLANSK